MSNEFNTALAAHAARTILESDRPLTREEIFPQNGEIYGRSLSRTWQRSILNSFVKDGYLTESTKKGVPRYAARNRLELSYIATACPPTVEDDEEPVRAGYNQQEWAKHARCQVAYRALKRLLASFQSEGKASRVQPRTTLFIAKKGDKFQEKQVFDQSWQTAFIAQLIEHGVVYADDEDGIAVYGVASESLLQSVIENGGVIPCVHTLLWPDDPCKIDHTKPTVEDQVTNESDPKIEAGLEESKPEIEQEKVASVEPDMVPLVPKAVEEAEAKPAIDEPLQQLIEVIKLNGKSLDTTNRLLTKLTHEIEHLHSKIDKVHDENVHLRTEHETMDNTICEVREMLGSLEKAFDPNEASISVVRKRLSELEKLAVGHKESLESSNKLIKTSLGEAAAAMVSAAAKAFIQTDHSAVLTKMQTMEEHVVESQSQVNHTLNEVFEALEKVRAEYKNNARTPAIFDRMNAIAEELKRLQALLPDLPAAVRVPSVDLSEV